MAKPSKQILWKICLVISLMCVISIPQANSVVLSSRARAHRRLVSRYMNRLGSKSIVNGRRMYWYCIRGGKLAICQRNHKTKKVATKSPKNGICTFLTCVHGSCVSDKCVCNNGWAGKRCNKDLNECARNVHSCQHICTNNAGSFRCSCRTGYALQSDGNSCKTDVGAHQPGNLISPRTANIDIGIRKPSNQSTIKKSFLRFPALTRWYRPHTPRQRLCRLRCRYKCVLENGEEKCVCPHGFSLAADKRSCVDLNECSNDLTPVCSVNQKCVNTYGGYSCKCQPGFTTRHGLFGKTCRDINECLSGEYRCSRNAQCINTLGSFVCNCIPGYTGNGIVCEKIDGYTDDFDSRLHTSRHHPSFSREWLMQRSRLSRRPELE